jgi:cephalosporin-C deacetylase
MPDYGFDPTYGYILDTLLQVPAPAEPVEFETFWRALYARALAVKTLPRLTEIASADTLVRVFEVEYRSLDHLTIGGWVTLPKQGPVERGVVVGHGYGGREGPDYYLPMRQAAAIFPCARGMGRSAHPVIPAEPARHVLHGIDSRYGYVLGGCVADTWCAATALLALFPEAAARLDYMGVSFGGGIGALALPWDPRFHSAFLCVPTFGNHPLRLTLPCVGSGEAVRMYHQHHSDVMSVLCFFDAATAAGRIRIPVLVAPALFDPAVPPPGQFAVYNALAGPRALFVLTAGHADYPGMGEEQQQLTARLEAFFREPPLPETKSS